jgi:nicotinate-nucleotide adenylyltransferase
MAVQSDTQVVHIFGGSFNPPHIGHVLAVCLARALHLRAGATVSTLVIPTYQHPFSKSLAPYEARLAMCERAFEWVADTQVSTVERDLGGESRTLRTLKHLKSENPSWQMRLVIGADILNEAEKWFGWSEIEQLAPPLVLGRQGIELGQASARAPAPMLPKVSSTEVREALGAGRDASALVPRAVLDYIEAHGLYRDASRP